MAKIAVAPLVGAWIEIAKSGHKIDAIIVAPLVGAWIEIPKQVQLQALISVAPLVGAWIEIVCCMGLFHIPFRRSPRGSVD